MWHKEGSVQDDPSPLPSSLHSRDGPVNHILSAALRSGDSAVGACSPAGILAVVGLRLGAPRATHLSARGALSLPGVSPPFPVLLALLGMTFPRLPGSRLWLVSTRRSTEGRFENGKNAEARVFV